MKHSDYSLIPTFVAIVEEKSYTKAAKRLGISQSAVSQGVTRLKDVLKTRFLFEAAMVLNPLSLLLISIQHWQARWKISPIPCPNLKSLIR